MVLTRHYTRHFLSRLCLAALYFLLLLPHVSGRPLTGIQPATFITKFPFTLSSRGIIIVKALLSDYTDTLNFVLDTGCGGISLDSSLASKLNITTVTTGETIKGISQVKTAEFIPNQQLRLPGLTVSHLNFHINDYSFLSAANDLTINGVIGYSFLQSYIVKINYDSLQIEVWTPGFIHYPAKGFVMEASVNKLAQIKATLTDNTSTAGRFYFDTGADISFLFTDKFVSDSNMIAGDKKLVVTTGEGPGGKKEMRLTTLKEVQIGPYTLYKVPVHIFDDPYNVFNYPTTDGIMGNELIQRFNITLNYPQNEIHLAANRHFNEPFNYAYSGCSISTVNGKLIFTNIIANSPAYQAGLQDNDIIFGINNNFKNDMAEYSNLLYQPGAKLKVFYLRGSQVRSTVVEVKSIL